jgi:hypothetical protein
LPTPRGGESPPPRENQKATGPAVRASIRFCPSAFVACCFSTFDFNSSITLCCASTFRSLFQELIKEHRIHGVVAYCHHLSILIPHNQIRIHFLRLLQLLSRIGEYVWIKSLFVVEGNWFEREDRFARFVHRFNRFISLTFFSKKVCALDWREGKSCPQLTFRFFDLVRQGCPSKLAAS